MQLCARGASRRSLLVWRAKRGRGDFESQRDQYSCKGTGQTEVQVDLLIWAVATGNRLSAHTGTIVQPGQRKLLYRRRKGCPLILWLAALKYSGMQASVLDIWSKNTAAPDLKAKAQELALALAAANAAASVGSYQGPHPSVTAGKSLNEAFRGWT